MVTPDRGRERVESVLEDLEQRYGSCPVNQSTVSVSEERYADVREAEPADRVGAYAAVHNDDAEVLHVSDGDGAELPGGRVPLDGALGGRVCQVVERQTGVECTLDGLERVTIVGIRDADDPDRETVYRVVVVFAGTHTAGRPGEGAEWKSRPAGTPPVR
jgi:hypothetical protein